MVVDTIQGTVIGDMLAVHTRSYGRSSEEKNPPKYLPVECLSQQSRSPSADRRPAVSDRMKSRLGARVDDDHPLKRSPKAVPRLQTRKATPSRSESSSPDGGRGLVSYEDVSMEDRAD
ncbi:hypothetical protein Leryth_000165 [Lithospermum erythrorhizon]|nr:hypothetical protein Leryth_000165 [Lithospermum erythrorhizon]